MADFLDRMATSSRYRVVAARRRLGLDALEMRAAAVPLRPLRLGPARFDLFAEIKRRSPSEVACAPANGAPLLDRARAYEAAGAAAISVLTEPGVFGGSLDHLGRVASAVAVPVLRKDFLVDPYQVVEARAAGASGVLLVLRLLDAVLLGEMLEAAERSGLFVLLEAFDAPDLDRAREIAAQARPGGIPLLVGLNCRDLATLRVNRARLGALRAGLPAGVPAVAESGMETPSDVAEVAALGYDAALVGGGLMRARDPEALAASMLRAGRARRATPCA